MKKLLLFSVLLVSFYLTQAQNLGIGVNPPTQKLDVNGNVKFSGALMPNNSAGNVNDVLLSKGAGIAPAWGDATAGQLFTTVYSTDSLNISFSNLFPHYLIPGLTQTITVPATGTFDAFVYTDGAVQWTSNGDSDNNSIQTDISIWYDGGSAGNGQRYEGVVVDNTSNFGRGLRNWSFCYAVQNIPVGVHTFEVKARIKKDPSPYPSTATFGDKNIAGRIRVASLSVVLIRK